MDSLCKPTNYRSFLLRLWNDSDSKTWRFSIEDPHTGERSGLANLDSVIAFLREVMEQAEDDSLGDLSG